MEQRADDLRVIVAAHHQEREDMNALIERMRRLTAEMGMLSDHTLLCVESLHRISHETESPGP